MIDKVIVHISSEIEDLVPAFLDNRRRDVRIIREALENADFETVRRRGHDMKGAGGGYGFTGITNIGAALEAAAVSSNREEIAKLIIKLESYLENLHLIVDQE